MEGGKIEREESTKGKSSTKDVDAETTNEDKETIKGSTSILLPSLEEHPEQTSPPRRLWRGIS